jgi:hypothetical protein
LTSRKSAAHRFALHRARDDIAPSQALPSRSHAPAPPVDLAVVTPALAGCGADFDTDQMRLCRQAIPPLNPPNAHIEIERTSKGPVPRALRLLYRVQLGDGLSRHRSIDCLFASEGTGPSRGALIGIAWTGGRWPMRASTCCDASIWRPGLPPPDSAEPSAEALPAIPAGLAYGLQQA